MKKIENFGYDTECEFRPFSSTGNGTFMIGQYVDSIFELNKNPNNWNVFTNYTICNITSSPTSNCQLYSIGDFQGVFRYENWYEILCFIQYNIRKNIVLLDVNVAYCHVIESKISKKDIISKIAYTSTNSSNMCIYLINTRNINKDANNYTTQPNWQNCNTMIAKAKYNKKKLLEKSSILNSSVKAIKEQDNTIDKIYNDLIEISND